jgi:hypothetical protein
MTSVESSVRGGLAIGVVDGGSRLMVNLPAAEAEGAQLDAAVLRIAEVIR